MSYWLACGLKVTWSTVEPFVHQFDALDVDNSGHLTHDDLEKLADIIHEEVYDAPLFKSDVIGRGRIRNGASQRTAFPLTQAEESRAAHEQHRLNYSTRSRRGSLWSVRWRSTHAAASQHDCSELSEKGKRSVVGAAYRPAWNSISVEDTHLAKASTPNLAFIDAQRHDALQGTCEVSGPSRPSGTE
ncbi:MAG: hypothetical protein SGPRY_013194, partial [Prymnesium sp.]